MGLLIPLPACVVYAKSNSSTTGDIINILEWKWSCGQSGPESLKQGQDSNVTVYEIVKEEIGRGQGSEPCLIHGNFNTYTAFSTTDQTEIAAPC